MKLPGSPCPPSTLRSSRAWLLAGAIAIAPCTVTIAQVAPAAPIPASAAATATPAPSATSATPPAAPSASTAPAAAPDPANLLLQQATFWRSQNTPDKAAFSLRRLLDLQPNNADALALLAQIDVEQGNLTEGNAFYNRLRQLNPADPRLAAVEDSLRIGPIDQSLLSQARLLTGAAKPAQAVRLYQRAFHGSVPPPTLAIEYYMALAAVDIDGFQTARNAMAAMVAKDPNDTANQLAYAILLCNREFTRDDGLTRLQALAAVPAVSAAARRTWRQVILWQGPSIQSMKELKAYISANGVDPQIQAQYDDFVQTVPSDGDQARDRGFVEISNSQWGPAEADFQTAIADNPKDWRALMMLAAIRNHQNRTQEAHDLIELAVAQKPEQKDFIIKSSGGDWSHDALAAKGLLGKPGAGGKGGGRAWTAADTRRAAARAASAYQARYEQVRLLTERGQYPQAERLLLQLTGHRRNAATYVQIGDLQLSAGRTTEAEASFNQALQLDATNADANAGLAQLYTQAGQPARARAYYAAAQTGYQRLGNDRGLASMNSLRAQQLRAQADAMTSAAAQEPLYKQALAIDPGDPWIRLSLARALQKQDKIADARAVMAATEDRTDTASIEAHIYFEQSMHDPARATAFVERLPARSRTAQMQQLQDQVALQQDIARIESLPPGENRRAALLALASRPDPTGQRVSAISDALVKMGDKEGVTDAVRVGLQANRVTDIQRVAYSGALVEADQPDAADRLLGNVTSTDLPRDQAIEADGVKDSIAVARSDQLNKANRPADAYDRLEPRLAANPNDPDLRLALSRLYASNGKPQKALEISRAVLQDNQGDMDVRRQAIGSAMAAKDYAYADQLVREGIRQSPSDPQLYILAADIDQARGANLRAVHDLQKARALRQAQLASN